MGYLLIKNVKYTGDKFYYESPTLTKGINIIEGPNGTGKTTFMNLIYYGLGGVVSEFNQKTKSKKHKEITSDTNNKVELIIEINNTIYGLTRLIGVGRNDIFVSNSTGEEDYLYSLYRTVDEKTFSDWLLEKLDIDVVELYQGTSHYKLNNKDLFRLIYHNQALDPGRIYKNPDAENFITDSELMRKTIFQLLVGKTFSEYYKVLAELRTTEKERSIAKSVLDEYNLIISNLTLGREELNETFLKESLTEKINQLDKLYQSRKSLKANRPLSSDNTFSVIKELKIKIADLGAKTDNKEQEKRQFVSELIRFQNLKDNIVLEVTQIKKIIHTHESLSLFSMDTCPYCLNNIDREENTCICGKEIDESEYQRFFYTSAEYFDILKSKQKSVKTINLAIQSLQNSIHLLTEELSSFSIQYSNTKNQIRTKLLEIEAGIDIKRLDEVDDKILEVKSEMIAIERLIEQQQQRSKYQSRFDKLDEKYQRLKLRVNELQARASSDMLDKVTDFSSIYNELMTKTLKNCVSAKIDSLNYMPLINNGEYREASSSVSIRLMYYLTILSLSLQDDEVKFPCLLLIDTPRTGGIDEVELDKALRKLTEELEPFSESKYQVILTTGLQTYPDVLEHAVFHTLSDNGRLLIKK